MLSEDSLQTTNIGPFDFDDDVEVPVAGEIEPVVAKKLLASKIYKWDDKEMLFALGSTLKQMAKSVRTQKSSNLWAPHNSRVMWSLVRVDTVQSWGWSTLSISKLLCNTMIDTHTTTVVVLGMLGNGVYRKVLLFANKRGQVSVMKLLATVEEAFGEAKNWNAIYGKFALQFKWNVRHEIWMGIPAVILPRLNQFITEQERLDNLEAVRDCLSDLFFRIGFVHDGVYWCNIGYFKLKGSITVVMLDLHPERVQEMASDGSWIETAIEHLRIRAATEHMP